jgi:DNA-binding NtrC family response regulator
MLSRWIICTMIRPCFLVIDREFPGSISTRKLVIETAKFNVLTAYSRKESLEILKRFPAVDGVVLDGGMEDISAEDLVRDLKALAPKMPIIVIAPPGFAGCPSADFQLESFAPAKLLEILRGLKPKESARIEKRDEDLSVEGRG